MWDFVPEELCYEILIRVPVVPLIQSRSVCKAWRRTIDGILPNQICLLIPILLRIPAATLFRFRSVCKEWCDIINDISFIRMHVDRQEDGNNLIVQRKTILYELSLSSIDPSTGDITPPGVKPLYGMPRIIRYFHGVPMIFKPLFGLGLRVRNILPYFPAPSYGGLIIIGNYQVDRTARITILNPFTRESVEIPPPPTESVEKYSRPKAEYHSRCGIGYNSATHEINVVRIFQHWGPENGCMILETSIYSLKSKYWKTIPNFPKPVYSDGVFVNGALHWILRKRKTSKCILAMDLRTEKVRVLPSPTSLLADNFRSLNLYVLGGCLCLQDDRAIWIMKDYKQCLWTELVTYDQVSYIDRPIAYIKRKNLLLFEQFGTELVLFDIENKCAKKVCWPYTGDFTSQVIPSSLFRLNNQVFNIKKEEKDGQQ